MNRMLAVFAIGGTLTLTGCIGGSAAKTTPTAVALKSYHDARFNFSFRYPGNWTVTSRGHAESQNGHTQYVLPINVHDSNVQLQVVLDGQMVPIPQVTPGKIGISPGGATFRYYNMRISGYLALQGQRFFKQHIVDDLETVVNTHSISFTVRMITGTPPFHPVTTQGYNTLLHSMKLPF